MTAETYVQNLLGLLITVSAKNLAKIPCDKLYEALAVVDIVDTVEGVCNGFLPYTRFLGFLEFSGYHQWQQESQ